MLDWLAHNPLADLHLSMFALLYAIEASAHRTAHQPERLALIDPAPVTREFRRMFENEFARRTESMNCE